ncbi:MAG: tRNA1(Val) (adenine(37)-N6)-methyltransferase [Muribaculaceae bacterium]
MREKVFRFKQFSVRNDRSAMKVGTDGVLLGAWCGVEGVRRVLDVGTGTGLIALMVAQRNADALIDAVEIDAEACSEARHNFDASPWSERLRVIHGDFLQIAADASSGASGGSLGDASVGSDGLECSSCGSLGVGEYDLIVSNPPYFTEDTTSDDHRRATARHTSVALTYSALIASACPLLADGGRICLISPVEREAEILSAASECGLRVARRLTVYPKPGAAAKRMLWELRKSEDLETQESELTIETLVHNDYTPAYIALTRDFYLKM